MSFIPWAALNRSSLGERLWRSYLDRGKMSPVRRKGKDIARCFKVRTVPGCLGSCSPMEDWQRCSVSETGAWGHLFVVKIVIKLWTQAICLILKEVDNIKKRFEGKIKIHV